MPGHPGLPSEFKARLKYTRSSLKRFLVCSKATDNPFPVSKIWGSKGKAEALSSSLGASPQCGSQTHSSHQLLHCPSSPPPAPYWPFTLPGLLWPWCSAARPEGGSGRGRRVERGSPSRSNEVISPEILKMRAALFCIFTYLDTRTLLHAAEVCRDWRFVARHPAVWTRVLLENARVCSKVPAPALLGTQLLPAVKV